MGDEEVAETIMQVKGLGPWSAQMYLMFTLGRLDIFAAGDLGIQKSICMLYGQNRDKTDFEAFGERWRPYRTIACWYLWAALDNR
jgi:DNA-3-methyladenine glycosylase II